jgi:hypothetical protein
MWAANQFCQRTTYGDDHLALVGDAVGHVHPLTATGLTLAMMDGECLARSPGIAAYSRERATETQVAEVLATALYRAFTTHDPATVALRGAIYEMWRRRPTERYRTMRLLAMEETRLNEFISIFLRTFSLAAQNGIARPLANGQLRGSARTFRGFRDWLVWLSPIVWTILCRSTDRRQDRYKPAVGSREPESNPMRHQFPDETAVSPLRRDKLYG